MSAAKRTRLQARSGGPALDCEYQFVPSKYLSEDEINELKTKELSSNAWKPIIDKLVKCAKDNKPPHTPMTKFVEALSSQFNTIFPKQVDTFDGEVQGTGYATLYSRVYHHFEYTNRNREDTASKTKTSKRKKQAPSLQNDCPGITPEETVYQENLREALIAGFRSNEQDRDWQLVKDWTIDTYKLQRHDINKSSITGDEIKIALERWPALFCPVGASAHMFVGHTVEPSKNVELFLQQKFESFKYFIVMKGNKDVAKLAMNVDQIKRTVQVTGRDNRSLEAMGIFQMLAKRLGEDICTLFFLKDNDFEVPDQGQLVEGLGLTPSPCFVAMGSVSLLRCNTFHCFVDGVRVTKEVLTALQCLQIVIPIHFIFNLRYEAGVSKTLEFIQRAIVKADCDTAKTVGVTNLMLEFDKFFTHVQ